MSYQKIENSWTIIRNNMHKLELTVPSKTFLVGEYLALFGGPSILINTTPRFKLEIKKSPKKARVGFSSQLPVTQLLEKNNEVFKNFSLKFIDPHNKAGGFGASSAELVLLYTFHNFITHKQTNLKKIISQYKKLTRNQGYSPSGADIASQFSGDITLFESKKFSLKKYAWPFAGLEFFLIRTNNKVNTYHHLMSLPNIKIHNLKKAVNLCISSFESSDEIKFCKAINQFGDELKKQNLICNKTLKLLDIIATNSLVLAAKGCGALGADVVLVITAKKHKNQFAKWAKQHKFNIIATNKDISPGIQINMKPNNNKNKTEMLIAVNKKDEQIGLIEKITAHKEGILHRAFSVVIYRKHNQQIELLLQKRSRSKYHSANLWSNTCCSHLHNEELSNRSAKERLNMEMGFTVPLKDIGSFYYKKKLNNGMTEHEIDHVFVGEYLGNKIAPNPKEVSDYCWVDITTLRKKLKLNPERYTPWLSILLKFLNKNYFGE